MVVGHEPSGWVAGWGAGMEGLKKGDRVLLAGVMGCGHCDNCRQGYNTACEVEVSGLAWKRHGVDAASVVVPASNVLPIPDEMPMETAAVLTCAGGTAYTTVQETALRPEDRLAIFGLGPVGLSLLILAKSYGVRAIGLDLAPERLRLAEQLGVDRVVDCGKEDPVAAVQKWSGGLGCEVVAECVGVSKTRLQALGMARTRGRVAMAGLGAEPLTFGLQDVLIGRQARLMGIAATPIRYFPSLIRWTAEKKLPFDKLITHRFPLEKAQEAFAVMESGKCGKVIFEVSNTFMGGI
jgi:threonine dehydrogenase-like Zn-dependent dehydrogenase